MGYVKFMRADKNTMLLTKSKNSFRVGVKGGVSSSFYNRDKNSPFIKGG